MRGIVVSPPIELTANGIHIRTTALDPQELRSWLLFWDKVEFPLNSIIRIQSSDDIEFLMAEGVLQRTDVRINLNGVLGGEVYLAAHLAAFHQNLKKEPGSWSLARGVNSISFPENEIVADAGLLFELVNAVPIPPVDMPFEEILRFKQSRIDEFLAFRHYIEELYQDVLSAPDRPLAERNAFEKVDKAAADQIRAARELPFNFKLSDFSIKFNWVDALTYGFAAYSSGMGLTGATIAGGVGATVRANVSTGIGLKSADDSSTPFEYVANIHRDLDWQ